MHRTHRMNSGRASASICPVCRSPHVVMVIDIQQVPIHCNLLWPSRDEALNAPRGDIRLGFCEDCGHIFNLVFNPALMQYTQAYENSLHFSPQFQDYARSLAASLIHRYHLRDKSIIEIGSGGGEFLALLCEGGQNQGVGFDPSYNSTNKVESVVENMTFIRDFYSDTYAEYQADFICCRQMLEHVQSPRDFLSQLRRTIGDRRDAVIFFEVPNVLYTLRDLGIWDIIYEHCSYFSAHSLAQVFTETDFKIFDLYESYGGQFLCIEAFPSESLEKPAGHAWSDCSEMAHHVEVFAENYRRKVESWRCHLDHIEHGGKRAVVWGAGSKGVSILNLLKVQDQIQYVVDLNPHKQGQYMAGTGQHIVPPNFLQTYQPDVVIIMNAIYQSEIQQLAENLGITTEFICA